MSDTVKAHAVGGGPGSAMDALLVRRRRLDDGSPGAFAPIVAEVSGPAAVLRRASAGLPGGAAHAEAVVARLRRSGVAVEWGEPIRVARATELLELCHRRGASSVALARADPSLVPQLQVGSWVGSGWRLRLARRMTQPVAPVARAVDERLGLRPFELALELAFWDGVRRTAGRAELRRLTGSSYVALYYHRIAGDLRDDRNDVPPWLFTRQLSLLRLLRFRPLSPAELLAFHRQQGRTLPRRSYVLTADDGFVDAARALAGAAAHRPQLFVATRLAGGRAAWAGGARLADWNEIATAAAEGVAIGSHTRSHPVLPQLAGRELEAELAGSLADLRRHLDAPLPLLAYPHGRHDAATRRATASAGYRAAFTTAPGRNGAGSDPLQLSRIGVKPWDSGLSFLWKATTGEHLPRPWERWRLWRHRHRVRTGRG